MRDFPFLHVVVSAVIHKQRESEAGSRERQRGREGEDGRQGQIAAFNRLPWGAAEGERVWERATYGEREAEVIWKETCTVAGWLQKKMAHWERLERPQSIHKRRSWHKRSPDGQTHTYQAHTYTDAPSPHTVQSFSLRNTNLWAVFLLLRSYSSICSQPLQFHPSRTSKLSLCGTKLFNIQLLP